MNKQARSRLWRFTATLVAMLVLLSACTDYDYDTPDTPANRAGFERHFGFPAPASVSDLYYYADELGADVAYQLGFKADQATVETIISELGLVQKEQETGVGLARDLDWWDADVIEGLVPYWKSNQDGDYFWYLWFDPGTQRVYHIEFSM